MKNHCEVYGADAAKTTTKDPKTKRPVVNINWDKKNEFKKDVEGFIGDLNFWKQKFGDGDNLMHVVCSRILYSFTYKSKKAYVLISPDDLFKDF